MIKQITITTEPINEAVLEAQRRASFAVGAVVCFLGLVRGMERQSPIAALEYESFQPMAEHQIDLILQQVERRWPIESVRLVHRVGVIKVNQASVWIEVLAPHRTEAFAALQFIIEEMKKLVPIWKKPLS